MEEDLDHFTNLEITYIQVVEPLRAIAQRANNGGADRFIARSQFRRAMEESDWYLEHVSFEDFQAGDDCGIFDGEEIYWVIYFRTRPDAPAGKGGITWTDDLEGPDDVLQKLIADEYVDLVVYLEYQLGYIYVLKSNYYMEGRLNVQQRVEGGYLSGIHPFEKVVVHDEDHPDYHTVQAPCLPPDILQTAADIHREYEDQEKKSEQ